MSYNHGRWRENSGCGQSICPVPPTDVYVHGQAVQLPKWQGWAKAARKKLEDMVADAHLPFVSDEAATTMVS